jgi:hypothetical protein
MLISSVRWTTGQLVVAVQRRYYNLNSKNVLHKTKNSIVVQLYGTTEVETNCFWCLHKSYASRTTGGYDYNASPSDKLNKLIGSMRSFSICMLLRLSILRSRLIPVTFVYFLMACHETRLVSSAANVCCSHHRNFYRCKLCLFVLYLTTLFQKQIFSVE